MRGDRISSPQSTIVASAGVKSPGQSCLVKQSGPLFRMHFDEIAAVIEVLEPIGYRELPESPREKHRTTPIVTVEEDTRSPLRRNRSRKAPFLSLPEAEIVCLGELHVCSRKPLHDPEPGAARDAGRLTHDSRVGFWGRLLQSPSRYTGPRPVLLFLVLLPA